MWYVPYLYPGCLVESSMKRTLSSSILDTRSCSASRNSSTTRSPSLKRGGGVRDDGLLLSLLLSLSLDLDRDLLSLRSLDLERDLDLE